MNKPIVIIIFAILLGYSSCQKKGIHAPNTDQNTSNFSSNLEFDHINIWVDDPLLTKQKLIDIGFNAVPDSLSQIHKGQGTSGRYFNFLNTYIELIFVSDQDELNANNRKNKDLDFTTRANFKQNGASPFSIALKMKDYHIDSIPFENVRYHQNWMAKDASIYAAKNSKLKINEPSVFVVYPEIEAFSVDSYEELDNFPSEDNTWKELFKHPNGAQKISKINITSKHLNDLDSETLNAVNAIKELNIQNGSQHLIEVYFDKHIQNKSFDLRPTLPLIIYL